MKESVWKKTGAPASYGSNSGNGATESRMFSVDAIQLNCTAAEALMTGVVNSLKARYSEFSEFEVIVYDDIVKTFQNLRNVVSALPILTKASSIEGALANVDTLLLISEIDFELVSADFALAKKIFGDYCRHLSLQSKADAAKQALMVFRSLTSPEYNDEHVDRVTKEYVRYIPIFLKDQGYNKAGSKNSISATSEGSNHSMDLLSKLRQKL